jgi:hypothetical protein
MILLVLHLLACSSLATPALSTDQAAGVPSVTYCELMRDIAKYDGQTVRVTAFVYFGIEANGLYDPDCPADVAGDGIWVEDFAVADRESPRAITRRLNRLVKKDGRAKVTIVGVFRGPKEVFVPEGTSPAVAKLMRDTNSRWGHLDMYCCAFEPMRIEHVEPVGAKHLEGRR